MSIGFVLILIYFVMHHVLGFSFQRKITPYNKRIFKKFESKTAVMNYSEIKLFRELTRCHSPKYLVFPMVRIEDVIQVKTIVRHPKARQALRGRIKSRHFDFVICDGSSLPLAVVELDGPSHKKSSQKKIDAFKDGLCEAVGIKMFRLPISKTYRLDVLRMKFE